MTLNKLAIAAVAGLALAPFATDASAQSRTEIKIVGSSTVLPYAQIVVEDFQREYRGEFSATVEGGGSSAGLKQFCEGLGPQTIDVANASRQIRASEVAACAANGVQDILEVRFGYDGIVFASDADGPAFNFTPADIFHALAAEVAVEGKLAPNPAETWKDINDAFPAWPIVMFVPGEKHGTREVFEEKVLLEGCRETGTFQLMIDSGISEDAAETRCIQVRQPQAVDIDGDYTETLTRLEQNKQSVGVFGLSFYENNTDKLRVATMDEVEPSVDTIAAGEYPVSRPLFFYVKGAHLGVIPGLTEYVEYFISEEIAGPDGPLADYGLVPAPDGEREAVRTAFTERETVNLPGTE